MSLFGPRKRTPCPAKPGRHFRFESLERRLLLAADSFAEAESSVELVPDFHLVDVNPNSVSFNTDFSPRDLLGQTGALYFAHST